MLSIAQHIDHGNQFITNSYGLFACVMLLVIAWRGWQLSVMTICCSCHLAVVTAYLGSGKGLRGGTTSTWNLLWDPRANESSLGLANPIAGVRVTGSPGSRVRV